MTSQYFHVFDWISGKISGIVTKPENCHKSPPQNIPLDTKDSGCFYESYLPNCKSYVNVEYFHRRLKCTQDFEEDLVTSCKGSSPTFSIGVDVALFMGTHPEDNIWQSCERSRRASTDVGRTTLSVPYTRSKSRSVDHGISSPFDLDLLRSKVEDRFDCVAGIATVLLQPSKKRIKLPMSRSFVRQSILGKNRSHSFDCKIICNWSPVINIYVVIRKLR
ncbi:hypothetical protein RUM43_000968 [Polyplax serrata]|uniref:Uncharacterized protein n=1 Tax=Polyplax serrata TaxID=468196 RepID=A0AAN8SD88_POLSC